MRCLMCDAEMILIKALADESVGVPGFERHTLQCSCCGDVEERLVFGAKAGSRPAEVRAPPVSPDAGGEPERTDVRALWERAFARMRGRSIE
jgi:hypothetical protein